VAVVDAMVAGGERSYLAWECRLWRGRIRLAGGRLEAALEDARAAHDLAVADDYAAIGSEPDGPTPGWPRPARAYTTEAEADIAYHHRAALAFARTPGPSPADGRPRPGRPAPHRRPRRWETAAPVPRPKRTPWHAAGEATATNPKRSNMKRSRA
jgi:hypothetical protein